MANQSINLRPSVLNLLLYAGDGFSVKIKCTDSAGAPIDITGAVTAQVRANRLAPADSALATFAVSMVDAYLGILTISLTGAQTQDLVASGQAKFSGVWDAQWTPSGLQPRTIIQGAVECVADVTR